MRYEIKLGKVVPSLFIDAPYDCLADAKTDIDCGIEHNCALCTLCDCSTQDALQRHNAKRAHRGELIGE